ncbi:MAG: xanthine dehydrogenase [Dehalococcoidia bacterium]
MALILVRGVNEFGSAVAHLSFAGGHAVVLHDAPRPDTCHRTMAFADAVFDGECSLEGITAVRVDDLAALPHVIDGQARIPVVTANLSTLLAVLQPDVLIDARMRKRAQPEPQRGLAPLAVGIGPNFVAGETADLIVETGFGEDFGRVTDRGATRPLAGEPPLVLGRGRERFIYAPQDGVFHTRLQIGGSVRAGEAVGSQGTIVFRAPFDGTLRGLTHDGVPVSAGTRIVEVDPRGADGTAPGIGPRQRRIAEVVLAAVEARLADPSSAAGG